MPREENQNQGPDTNSADTSTDSTAVQTSGTEGGAASAAIVPPDGGDPSHSPQTRSFLDSISEPNSEPLAAPPAAAKPGDKVDEVDANGKKIAEPLAKPEAKQGAAAAPGGAPAAGATEQAPGKPLTEIDKEEAEVLAEVKSPRGQERVKKMFATLREKEADLAARNGDLAEFQEMITSTGVTPQDFAQQLEFGRLVNSGKPEDLRVALKMAEQVQVDIAKRLGIEVPGFDPLSEHKDLAEAVDKMDITRAHALELAQARNLVKRQQTERQFEQERQQNNEQFTALVTKAGQTMESYLQSRAAEPDHPLRLEALVNHFKDPKNMQEFVSTYQPDQWLTTIKYMYDNAQRVGGGGQQQQQQQPNSREQPMRSRPAGAGNPVIQGDTPVKRLASFIDGL